ncbi:TPA: hypothetical protein ACH3X1_016225 [Trebouxia sp. C0004]
MVTEPSHKMLTAKISTAPAKELSNLLLLRDADLHDGFLGFRHQMVGVNFLMLLRRQSISGSILADEMGLGKTAQAICFLGVLKHVDQDSGPHLVVAPVSLLENWQRELRCWCPGLCLVTYYGKDRAQLRRQLLDARPSRLAVSAEPEVISIPGSDSEEGSRYSASNAEPMEGVGQCYPEQPFTGRQEPPFNVMLTCYTLFETDPVEQQADRTFLKKWQWSHLLLDEAHAVKNANAMRTKRLTRSCVSSMHMSRLQWKAEKLLLQAKGSRALIFSQWTSVLDILGWLLEMMGLTYVRLDGSTAVADRLSTVDLSVPLYADFCNAT